MKAMEAEKVSSAVLEESEPSSSFKTCYVCGLPKLMLEFRIQQKSGGYKCRSRTCKQCVSEIAAKKAALEHKRRNRALRRRPNKQFLQIERKTIVAFYDCLRFINDRGGRVDTNEFVEYLHRSSCGRCSRNKCDQKRLEILSRLTAEAAASGEDQSETEPALRRALSKSDTNGLACRSNQDAKRRQFERLKQQLRWMGIECEAEVDSDKDRTDSFFIISDIGHWVNVFERMLSHESRRNYRFKRRDYKTTGPRYLHTQIRLKVDSDYDVWRTYGQVGKIKVIRGGKSMPLSKAKV